jgi:hypothetical protein
MGVLTKYDQIEPIYLSQSAATYISLHPAYPLTHMAMYVIVNEHFHAKI